MKTAKKPAVLRTQSLYNYDDLEVEESLRERDDR